MAKKKSTEPTVEIATEIQEAPTTIYSTAEKKILVANYKQAEDQIRILEDQLKNAQQAKSDVCFEMQKAFGSKKFTIDGVPCQVISHKYDGREEATYYLKRQSNEPIVDHF